MLPIIWEEHGIRGVIRKTTPTGKTLHNMRDGKPYFRDGELFVNINGSVHHADVYEFYNATGRKLKQEEIKIDTEVRIGAVILKDEEVLLFHRLKKGQEYYAFPGGHQLTGEADLETLSREIKEETGLEITAEMASLFQEFNREGFGTERFYLVRGLADFSKLKPVNPDERPGESNKPVFMDIKIAAAKSNVYPQEVIKKLAD